MGHLYKFLAVFFVFLFSTQLCAQVITLVKDIEPGANSSSPQFLIDFNGELYFGTSMVAGLWKSDGTVAGTVVAEGLATIGNDVVSELQIYNNKLYFNTFVNKVFWSKNVGIDNAVMVANQLSALSSGSYTSTILASDFLIFGGADYSVAGNPVNLFRSNGAMVEEFGSFTSNSSGPIPFYIGKVGSRLLFSAIETATGRELYSTDATTATTQRLTDIYPGTLGGLTDVTGGLGGNILNGEFYFSGFSPDGKRIWKTDGTAAGTIVVDDLTMNYRNPTYLSKYDNSIFFFASSSSNPVEQLWRVSSGDTAPTLLTTTPFSASSACTGHFSMVNNGILYFPYEANSAGCELWRTDGTQAGTYQLIDINPGSDSSHPKLMLSSDNILYFSALKAGFGFEIWKTDGTQAGTTMLADFNPGNASNSTYQMVESGGIIYLMADDGTTGTELYKLDFPPPPDDLFGDGFEQQGPI
jgi:ELWxxDGT repeat protein